LLEEWFAVYPESERDALKSRLINDFHAGFLELFLHSYFRSTSFVPEPHPSVRSSSKKPDYLIRNSECEFYLEATVARDKSDEDIARQTVKNLLMDAINSIKSPNFFLALEDFSITPGKQPAARKIKVFLERELLKYNPDDVARSLTTSPLGGPVLEFRDDAMRVTISLVPRSEAARAKPDIRPIGVYPIETYVGGSDTAIKESLNDKATRYGDLDRSYVVCVNYIGEKGVDQDDILDALFGTLQVSIIKDDDIPISSRQRNGVFMGPDGPWNTRVTAVVISNLFPWNLTTGRLELYHNPWTKRPLSLCSLPLRQASLVNNKLEWLDGISLTDLFGLWPTWPNQP